MLTGGQMTTAVVIDSDGLMEKDPNIYPPAAIHSKEELAAAARAAGLVGLGGAGFPAHVKLNVPEGKELDTLIVNVAECEPYVTSDHREALENGRNVLEGVYKVKEILGVSRVLIAVEDNKPDVIQKLREIADNKERDPQDQVRVLPLKSRYPQGAEKVLVQACTGRKVPAGGLPADVGCLVMNIASISFLASYMRTGMPLTLKRVTVDGSAVAEPKKRHRARGHPHQRGHRLLRGVQGGAQEDFDGRAHDGHRPHQRRDPRPQAEQRHSGLWRERRQSSTSPPPASAAAGAWRHVPWT